MFDLANENIILSPSEIEVRKPELIERYHAQAVEARKRFENNYQILIERWGNKEMAAKVIESFSFIGALTIYERDYLTLPDSPLKDFIDAPSENYDGRFRYRMTFGSEVNIRGEAYYQFFDRDQKASQRLEMSINTLKDLSARLPEIQKYLESKPDISAQELVVYLAYLDHLKIELLRIYHAQTHIVTGHELESETEEVNSNIQNALKFVTESFYSVLDGNNITHFQLNQAGVLLECEALMVKIIQKSNRGADLNGVMIGLPEGDNGLFNKLYAIGVAKRIEHFGTENLVLAGMHFGGVELPWVVLQETRLIGLNRYYSIAWKR